MEDGDVAGLFIEAAVVDGEGRVDFERSRRIVMNGLVHAVRAGDEESAKQVRDD